MDKLVTWHQQIVSFVQGKLARDEEKGASLVEYALLVALIAIVCILAITFLGEEASEKFSGVGSSLNS
jgi:pilus assembly protein Flp/PilA